MAASAAEDDDVISSINVTPLVDVVLVLLIIFMVTAKVIVSQGMPMDLPRAASGHTVQTVLSVELLADGSTHVDGESVQARDQILQRARQALRRQGNLRAVIRADARVSHGRVIGALDSLRRAGVRRIAFAVDPERSP